MRHYWPCPDQLSRKANPRNNRSGKVQIDMKNAYHGGHSDAKITCGYSLAKAQVNPTLMNDHIRLEITGLTFVLLTGGQRCF
jgi:hypothetical protein